MTEDFSNLIEVPVGSLRPGMYIAQLDRPWLETPFAVQGFYVRDDDDVGFVAKHCAYVYVDPRRRMQVKAAPRKALTGRQTHTNKVELKQELKVAKTELESAAGAMQKVFTQLKTNRQLNLSTMQKAINPLIDSVLRNNEAISALLRIKSRGDYLYNHSLSNAVWAALLGRHLGLDVPTLKNLALGAAVVDVGMVQIEDSITGSASALTSDQRTHVHKHVSLGIKLLRASGSVDPDVISIVQSHHERHDGSGYPEGLKGDDIPLLARIVGLVDSYDAMITDRPWALGRSSFEAMQELADAKDRLFQSELVEQFLQAIGMFPTGSVVELNTGEVGVVVQQNPTRRLRPKIVVILDPAHKRHEKLVVIDLANYAAGDGKRQDLWISRELKVGEYGIQPDEFFL